MTANITTRERRAHNHLKRLGFQLNKTPARHWTRKTHGVGYMVTRGNITFAGYELDIDGPGTSRDYTMTLGDVEAFIAAQAAHKVDDELRAVLQSYKALGGDRFVEVAAAMVREAA